MLYKFLADLELGEMRYLAQTGSTNADAAEWAERGAPDRSLVIADEQTAGRGRLQRRWITPAGTALAFSMILDAQNLPEDIPLTYLTALGALAVSDALRKDYDLPVEIKWPNDVLLSRCKVAGVLTEAVWQGDRLRQVILGVGVNVDAGAFPAGEILHFPATCVNAHLEVALDRWALLHAILKRLLDWKKQLAQPAFRNAWEANLAYRGEWVTLFSSQDTKTSNMREGQVLGLELDGRLRLRDRAGEVFTAHSGEIRLRPIDKT